MLTNEQLVALKEDRRFKKVIRVGLKAFVSDLGGTPASDLSPDVKGLSKVMSRLMRQRIIRCELQDVAVALTERLLNSSLADRRTVDMVEALCDSTQGRYRWMRFDVPRVEALFARCYRLLTDSEFRTLVTEHSSIEDQEVVTRQFKACLLERDTLKDSVIDVLERMPVFQRELDRLYRRGAPAAKARFMEAQTGGALGRPPDMRQLEHHNG